MLHNLRVSSHLFLIILHPFCLLVVTLCLYGTLVPNDGCQMNLACLSRHYLTFIFHPFGYFLMNRNHVGVQQPLIGALLSLWAFLCSFWISSFAFISFSALFNHLTVVYSCILMLFCLHFSSLWLTHVSQVILHPTAVIVYPFACKMHLASLCLSQPLKRDSVSMFSFPLCSFCLTLW